MRLFIALQLNDRLRSALTGVQEDMLRQGVRGNYTKPENLHLTLVFLGEYGNPERVLETMAIIPLDPLNAVLEGFGNFGDLYWTGIRQNASLDAYVKRLRRVLAERDIPFDRKRFSPHITLVRQAVCKNGLPHVQVPEAVMEVRRVSLMRSDRGKHGMIYTEIGGVDVVWLES